MISQASNKILLCDVFSYGKGREQYGCAGDQVTVISDEHGEVLIVENERGFRFPVHSNKVSSGATPHELPISAPAIETPRVNASPVKAKQKTSTQPQLF